MNEHDLSVPVRTVGRHRWRWIMDQFVFEQLGWVAVQVGFKFQVSGSGCYTEKERQF